MNHDAALRACFFSSQTSWAWRIFASRAAFALALTIARVPPFCGYFIKMGELLLTVAQNGG